MGAIERVLYTSDNDTVSVPNYPLATGALKLDYIGEPDKKVYQLLLKLTQHWKSHQLADSFYNLARWTNEDGKVSVSRQIIPYPSGKIWGYLCQIQVLWNLLMPHFLQVSRSKVLGNEAELIQALQASPISSPSPKASEIKEKDFVCKKPEQVKKQCISDQGTEWVLTSLEPLAEREILITPKEHCDTILDTPEKDFVRLAKKADLIAKYYLTKYPIVYVHYASGATSGQVVPHGILKITVAQNQWQEFLGYIKNIGKILGIVRPLSDDALAKRRERDKEELKDVIATFSQL